MPRSLHGKTSPGAMGGRSTTTPTGSPATPTMPPTSSRRSCSGCVPASTGTRPDPSRRGCGGSPATPSSTTSVSRRRRPTVELVEMSAPSHVAAASPDEVLAHVRLVRRRPGRTAQVALRFPRVRGDVRRGRAQLRRDRQRRRHTGGHGSQPHSPGPAPPQGVADMAGCDRSRLPARGGPLRLARRCLPRPPSTDWSTATWPDARRAPGPPASLGAVRQPDQVAPRPRPAPRAAARRPPRRRAVGIPRR